MFTLLRSTFILALFFLPNIHAEPDAAEHPQAYDDLIKMKPSLIGNCSGKGQIYDKNTNKIRTLKFQRNISAGPFPYTFVIEGYTEMEDGRQHSGYEIMGVRAGGAVVRQLLFQNGNSSYKEEVVIDYNINSDSKWSLTFLEYVEGVMVSMGPASIELIFSIPARAW